jgi:hypothetical protein
MLFKIVLFYVGGFYNPQNVPNNTTLLSNMFCTKLSSFHLHNWAKGEPLDIFFMKEKSSILGILQRSFFGGPQSCHGGHMQSLFAHTLNQLPKKMHITRLEPMMSYNGGIMNRIELNFHKTNHIFIQLYTYWL